MKTYAQKKLQPASFRGVPFEVTASSFSTGRRVQVHEYPQRDTPFCEDLGRSSRTITIEAFVTGQDYVEKMRALLKAIEEPGAGVLVHPWLGSLNVVPTSAGSANFTSTLLVASVSLDFVESGEKVFPTVDEDPTYLGKKLADALEGSALSAFIEGFDISGVQDFVAAAVTGNLADLLQSPILQGLSGVFDQAEDLANLTSDALTLLSNDPEVLGRRIMGAVGLGNAMTTVTSWRKVAHQLSRLTKSNECNRSSSLNVTPGTSRSLIKKNNVVAEAFVRQLTVANLVRSSILIGTPMDRINESATVKLMAYDDLIEARNDILNTLDAEMLKTTNDDVFRSMQSARTAVWRDMTTRAEQHARLVTFTPSEVIPAVVLAYDYYGDASREAEIVERNNLRDGGFVPVRPLKMMSE